MLWPMIVLTVVILGVGFLLFYSNRSTSRRVEELKNLQENNQAMGLMQQQIGQLTDRVDRQLQSVAQQLQTTTGHIGERIAAVKEDVGKVSEATRQVFEAAKDISRLEKLLKAPKFRGGLGELFLGDLLAQILPPSAFFIQHRFKSGEMVDAAVKIGTNLVPVDSKFPLENFRRTVEAEDEKEKLALKKIFIRDVKKHIDDIARKYILPDEGTFDFALMYIPAENIYYETIVRDESLGEEKSIFSFALRKRVIPVSPNSFYAYLQVILLGLKGLQFEEGAQEIIRSLNQLQGDFDRFKTDFDLVGTHLSHATGKFTDAEKRLDRFSDKLVAAGEVSGEKLPEESAPPPPLPEVSS